MRNDNNNNRNRFIYIYAINEFKSKPFNAFANLNHLNSPIKKNKTVDTIDVASNNTIDNSCIQNDLFGYNFIDFIMIGLFLISLIYFLILFYKLVKKQVILYKKK